MPEFPLALRFDFWSPTVVRLSWPGMPGRYRLWAGDELGKLAVAAELEGTFPETVWTAPVTGAARFYRLERLTDASP